MQQPAVLTYRRMIADQPYESQTTLDVENVRLGKWCALVDALRAGKTCDDIALEEGVTKQAIQNRVFKRGLTVVEIKRSHLPPSVLYNARPWRRMVKVKCAHCGSELARAVRYDDLRPRFCSTNVRGCNSARRLYLGGVPKP